MLTSRFQRQLQQNERMLLETKAACWCFFANQPMPSDATAMLQETLAAREALCERLQRSVQRASQRLDRAAHAAASAQRELRRHCDGIH